MAHFRHRHPENVPGKFYTDILCLDCTACRDIAPTIFVRDELHNSSIVLKQPETAEEVNQCEECIARCPCNAIGDDGDEHDWVAEPRDLSYVEPDAANAPHAEEARWKFW